MKVKSVLSSLFVVAAFTGFISVGVAHADLGFADWAGSWFSVEVSEDGKAGPSPAFSFEDEKPYSNDEKKSTAYLYVGAFDIGEATYDVVYCRFDGNNWARITDLQWSAIGGKPKEFLAFFSVSWQDTDTRRQSYWVPLSVKGKESSSNAGEIISGSFKNLGGVFVELRADENGMGEVKFKGTFVAEDAVLLLVPDDCRETL